MEKCPCCQNSEIGKNDRFCKICGLEIKDKEAEQVDELKEDYPEILTARDIAKIMKISLSKAYDMMEWKGFPLIRLGRNKRVSKEAFFQWIESYGQAKGA